MALPGLYYLLQQVVQIEPVSSWLQVVIFGLGVVQTIALAYIAYLQVSSARKEDAKQQTHLDDKNTP